MASMIGESGRGRLPHFRGLTEGESTLVLGDAGGVEMGSVASLAQLLLNLCEHGRRSIVALDVSRRLFIPSRTRRVVYDQRLNVFVR